MDCGPEKNFYSAGDEGGDVGAGEGATRSCINEDGEDVLKFRIRDGINKDADIKLKRCEY